MPYELSEGDRQQSLPVQVHQQKKVSTKKKEEKEKKGRKEGEREGGKKEEKKARRKHTIKGTEIQTSVIQKETEM